jgi:hypothetical protein
MRRCVDGRDLFFAPERGDWLPGVRNPGGSTRSPDSKDAQSCTARKRTLKNCPLN